jgi:hypothetical protein
MFLVYEVVQEKHVCVNLIRVSPLMKLITVDFTMGQAIHKASSNKVDKYNKMLLKEYLRALFSIFQFV